MSDPQRNEPLELLEVAERRLDVVDAELWIVGPPEMTGRLTGPKTRYASTIEVPFYLQKIPHPEAPAGGQRVLIPEPSLWSPETPYLYEAKLDLGTTRGRVRFEWGFRKAAWTREGLRVNGTVVQLQATRCATLAEAEALDLRERGYNVIVLPVASANPDAWTIADRVGLFVVGEVGHEVDAVRILRFHASALGWILDSQEPSAAKMLRGGARSAFVGVHASKGDALPAWAQFVVGEDLSLRCV